MKQQHVDDLSKSVMITDRIVWVGRVLPDDDFQCHAYLILNGNQSVLIDPGSIVTIEVTKQKIQEHISLNDIKFIVCQHQDPDITSCIGGLEREINRDDLQIVSHSRAFALLKHYDWKSSFYAIDQHQWKLDAGDGLNLEFIFTPYLHFPGAFCSYEPASKIMFSSDLFGGFTDSFSLYAKDMSYFESIRPFHQHYMPANEILVHALNTLSKYDMELIAPQHGSILRRDLILPIIEELKKLECGYYLEPVYYQNIRSLIQKNNVLKEIISTMAKSALFSDTIIRVKDIIRRVYPIKLILVYLWDSEGQVFFLSSAEPKGKRKIEDVSLHDLKRFQPFREVFETKKPCIRNMEQLPGTEIPSSVVTFIPLITDTKLAGIGVMVCDEDAKVVSDDDFFLKLFSPIAYAAEREENILDLENDRDRMYHIAISDPLTGLFNRHHLKVQGEQEIARAQRYGYRLSLLMLDIDDFKMVNDQHGHQAGDRVLQSVAKNLQEQTREFDINVRFGGEEMLVLLPHTTLNEAWSIADRIRFGIQNSRFPDLHEVDPVTVSIGVVERKASETLDMTIARADEMLYRAKRRGKNRVEGKTP